MMAKVKRGWFDYIDKLFWAMLLGIASYATSQFQQMNKSINTLNSNMATVITTISAQDKLLDRHESRIEYLERNRKSF